MCGHLRHAVPVKGAFLLTRLVVGCQGISRPVWVSLETAFPCLFSRIRPFVALGPVSCQTYGSRLLGQFG